MRPIDADTISVKSEIESVREVVEIILDEAPTLNAIVIPENATNGDVIKAMFPNADYEIGKQFVHITNINSIGELSIPLDWWNAPYEEDESIKNAFKHEEEREGEWQEHDNYFDCPFCGCLAPSTDTADAFVWKLSNYCPDCKAKLGDGTLVIKKHALNLGILYYKKAIEDIKAEIWQEHDSCGNKIIEGSDTNFSDGVATAYGLELAIEIINKHTERVSK